MFLFQYIYFNICTSESISACLTIEEAISVPLAVEMAGSDSCKPKTQRVKLQLKTFGLSSHQGANLHFSEL